MKKLLGICLLVLSGLGLTSVVFAQLVPIQQNVTVTASVPPRNVDFQFDFNSDGQTSVPQNTTLSYDITYGASASAGVPTTTTIVADFSDDTAPDSSHVLDYVIGSATDGFGGAQPVVNLSNRTITWTIPNMPAGTMNQTVSFQLRSNENYTDDSQLVSFTIRAQFSNQYVTLPDQTVTQSYQFDQSLVTPTPTVTPTITLTPTPTITPTPVAGPTATPGPAATPTNGPTPTVTPTPSVTPPQLQIVDVAFTNISDSAATVAVTTNQPATVTIRYGTSPTTLNQTVQTSQPSTFSQLQISDLKPDAAYYFQISANGAQGAVFVSEIFTFTTARDSQAPALTNNTVVITSNGRVILSGTPNGSAPFGILTTQTDYVLTYTFSHVTALKSFDVIVRDKQGNEVRTVHLNEQESQVYVASLRSGDAGLYDVFVRLTDPKGNVIEQNVALLKFTRRLQVLEQGSNLPITDARVLISRFNSGSNQYEPIDGTNPVFTNNNGETGTILPKGKYRAEVSALLYAGRTVEFTLGELDGQDFPAIYLERDPLNLSALVTHVTNMIVDSFNATTTAVRTIVTSPRTQGVVAGAAVGSFAFLSSLLFMFRTDLRWRDLLPFLVFNMVVAMNKHRQAYLYGIVLDKDKQPVSRARIEVVDLKTNTVLTHALSNKSGRFAIKNTFKQQYIKFQITKEGFAEVVEMIPTDTKKLIEINLDFKEHKQMTIVRGLRHTFGELFELILLVSLIAELIFLFNFGIAKTLPFFLLSVLNLSLWIFFQREKKL